MKLVIAEKPSVAQSLSAVIGATARKDGYLEGSGWRVSWCVGHLAGLADADSYDPKYAKWRYDDLPILPEHWQMVVGKDKKKQFDILKKLMNAPDVTEVVNACDAGRDDEVIGQDGQALDLEHPDVLCFFLIKDLRDLNGKRLAVDVVLHLKFSYLCWVTGRRPVRRWWWPLQRRCRR